MKKITSLAVAALAIGMTAMAVPAKRVNYTFTQPDGSTIELTKVGDENFHSYVTSDGLAVRQDANGTFRYITSTGLSEVAVHNPADRGDVESRFIAAEGAEITFEAAAVRANALPGRNTPAKTRAAAPKKASQVPQTGSPRIPILLVQYKDVQFIDGDGAFDTFTNFFEEGSTSARQYFVDQSNGKYTPQFDIYGPVTLSQKRSYYGNNNYSGDDKYVGKMVAEACNLLNSEVDFSIYDNDGDGECDVVILLYAGVGEASSNVSAAIWPCQWELSASDYGRSLNYDGTKIDKFAVFNELYGNATNQIDGIGTFCHEFSHCLDLPDFYDTAYSGKYFGMSEWSLLDYGCYNDDGYTPIGYSAYEKNFMGWVDLPEATPGTLYTLPVWNRKDAATDVAVKITNDANKNEYYVIENRRRQGWDKFIASDGLLITHVTYDASAWKNNTVNNYATQRMTPIPADGSLKMSGGASDPSGLAGDLWPYGKSNELTDTSTPPAAVYTGGYMHKPVTEIMRNADGTISFWYIKPEIVDLAIPDLGEAEAVTSTGFTASWSDVSVDVCDITYTLEVTTHLDNPVEEIISTNFAANPDGLGGWTGLSTGYNEYDPQFTALRLGSQKKNGRIDSPQFDTDDSGKVTIRLQASAYTEDTNVPLKVSVLSATNSVVDTKTLTLNEEAAHVVVLDAPVSTKAKVRIETTTIKKRALIYYCTIWAGDAYDVAMSMAPSKAPQQYFSTTFEGITDTTYTVTGLPAGGTYDYRVRAVSTEPYRAADSDWSPRRTVSLAGGLEGDVNGDGQVNIADVQRVLNIMSGAEEGDADVNGDGTVNIADAQRVLNLMSGAE